MRSAFGKTLSNLATEDCKVYALDGDLGNSTKVDEVAKNVPNKFLQMGIAEQNMMSVAAGLATTGLQPWATSFAAFLSKRALDQIQVQIAQPKLDVKIIGGYSGLLTSKTGKTHQSLEDIAIFRTLSNMIVLAPVDDKEVEEMMKFANNYFGPVYMRISRDNYPQILPNDYTFELGKAVKLMNGEDITILSTGSQTNRSLEAAKILRNDGLIPKLLHLPSIKPIDKEAIIDAASTSKLIVTAEEHSIIGGLGSAVAEILSENKPTRLLRIGVEDKNAESAPNDELLKKYGISTENMVEKIKNEFKKL
ncbi:transketolase family protein [Salinicoccus sp. YB14-2]|uniref:transketolase family protein n=1 Tax=Salinicoccus sp. YB14-2 TaxID=1572701 RepID=UPI000A99CEF1|nr:transketolase C-terminal domain-containing protein [Salinicoccus sp. YB14-2]